MRILNPTPFPFAPMVLRTGPASYQATLAVKGTFELRSGEAAAPAPAQPPFAGDVYDDGDLTRECLYDLDLAPFKPRADLLLKGTCHPPKGGPATVCRVTFSVGKWSKSLVAIGDRTAKSGLMVDEVSAPLPFTSMPIRYSRSYGAPGWATNPVGKGRELSSLPNIESSEAAAASLSKDREPAGFGPWSRFWPPRSTKAGTAGKDYLQTRWPGPPANFDPGYHNAAPPDQQVPYLRGDEELRLLHLHPGAADFRGRLPGLRLRCILREKVADGSRLREIALNLDTLFVDSETLTLTLVWRGLTDTPSEDFDQVLDILILAEPLAAVPAPLETLEPSFVEPKAEAAPPPPQEDPKAPSPKALLQLAETQEAEAMAKAREAAALAGFSFDDALAQGSAPASLDQARDGLLQSRESLVAAGLPIPPGLDEQIAEMEEGGELDLTLKAAVAGAVSAKPLTREGVVRHLARRGSFSGWDLSGLDLTGLDFTRADLSRSILKKTNLAKTKMSGANLKGAQMSEANLTRADLSGADLSDGDATDANLAGADLQKAELQGANFNRAKLPGANLSGANAARAGFSGADLTKSFLRKTCLDEADLSGCVLEEANFSRATLKGATLQKARGAKVSLDRADLTRLCARGADLPGASFLEATAEGSLWQGARLEGADFSSCGLFRAQFPGATVRNSSFFRADLRKASFRKADLQDARLQQANLMGASFEKAALTRASFVKANLFEAEFLDAVLEGADFERANVQGTKLAT